MGKMVAIIMIVVLLGGGLAAATYASYNGYGLVAVGNPSARSGSMGGPIILGGGPGSGK